MNRSKSPDEAFPEGDDPVWKLVTQGNGGRAVEPSPWFATRVTALALATPQKGTRPASLFLRWLLPIPLTCSALLALACWNHIRAADEKFEQHMEFLSSSPSDYEV